MNPSILYFRRSRLGRCIVERGRRLMLLTGAGVACGLGGLSAQTTEAPWRYTLIHGATLTDDCPICGRPAVMLPMRGTFDLSKVDENPLFTTYALEAIEFSAGSEGGPRYVLRGRGAYEVGGEVAVTQRLTLELTFDDGHSVKNVSFASDHGALDRLWPMLGVTVKQTNGTMVQQIDLQLSAAPFRDLWFSTNHGMTSGATPPPFAVYGHGDLLSRGGHRVKSNTELTRRLGIMPAVPDIGLDAVEVRPGGEIAYSSTEAVFSESLGWLRPGDVLSDQGRVLLQHEELIRPFSPMPPVTDVGLDALHDMGKGGVAFSSTSEFFSERLGRKLGRGDLLASDGVVLRTNQDLLARFHPVAGGGGTVGDLGLDAVHLWPGGEIWFSTEAGFQDQELGVVRGGDILSDSGYIVFQNLDLVAAFSPLEDLADFGVDGLVVVSDVLDPLPPPVVRGLEVHPSTGAIRLEWLGDGRFFQVLGARTASGPYMPLTEVQTDHFLDQAGWIKTHPEYFYRVRQW